LELSSDLSHGADDGMAIMLDSLPLTADALELSSESHDMVLPDEALNDALGDLDDVFNEPEGSIAPIEVESSAVQSMGDDSPEFNFTDILGGADPLDETALDMDSSWNSRAMLASDLGSGDAENQPSFDAELDMDDLFGDADADENLPEVADFGLESLDTPSLSGSNAEFMQTSGFDDLFDMTLGDDGAELSTSTDLEHFNLSQESVGKLITSTEQAAVSSSITDDWQIPDDLFDEALSSPVQSDAELSLDDMPLDAIDLDNLPALAGAGFVAAEPDVVVTQGMVAQDTATPSVPDDEMDGLLDFSLDDVTDYGDRKSVV